MKKPSKKSNRLRVWAVNLTRCMSCNASLGTRGVVISTGHPGLYVKCRSCGAEEGYALDYVKKGAAEVEMVREYLAMLEAEIAEEENA